MSNAMLIPLIKMNLGMIFDSNFVNKSIGDEVLKSNEIIKHLLLDKRIGEVVQYFVGVVGFVEQYNGVLNGDKSMSSENLQKIALFLEPFLPLFNNNFEPLVELTKEVLKEQYYSNKEPIIVSIKDKFLVDTETADSMFLNLIDKLTSTTIELLQLGTLIDFIKEQYNGQWLDCVETV